MSPAARAELGEMEEPETQPRYWIALQVRSRGWQAGFVKSLVFQKPANEVSIRALASFSPPAVGGPGLDGGGGGAAGPALGVDLV